LNPALLPLLSPHALGTNQAVTLRMGRQTLRFSAFLAFIPALTWADVGAPPPEQGQVLSTEGHVDWSHTTTNWVPANAGQQLYIEERLRTLAASRAMVQLAELGRMRINELTILEILPPRENRSKATIDLKAGAMYFFTRERPREFLIQTPHALAASRGTEFSVRLTADGQTVFDVFDGEVELTNGLGSVTLRSGEEGAAAAGQAPRRTAVIQASNLVQWWLYYPAVIDPGEFPLTAAERAALAASLQAYTSGNLLAALASYPASRTPQTDGERLYLAAISLAVGRVSAARELLAQINSDSPQRRALEELIATVTLRSLAQPRGQPQTASEWLARSYTEQGTFNLNGALAAATRATELSPDFGFPRERVAEIEFSQGHTGKAEQALAKALQLTPNNAQAWALQGFLAAARNRWSAAEEAFERSIRLDPALGNAWLGRGLVRIRRGDKSGGQADLQTAAAMEPNRSLLRSYLAKAFDHERRPELARKELRLAKEVDAGDPTPWLYSALVLRQQLEYNPAIEELEKSQALNDNRGVYRSRLLLDEDLAVRSANLAAIYHDAGLTNVSVREAARAVASDYANFSAHLFLAESFDALRDPTRFNLRYETPWFNEWLLANMLAPAGAGNLSQNISQQEYTRFFDTDRLGLSSTFEGRSDGQYREFASQFGNYGGFGYSLDLDYQHNDGVRPNNQLDRTEWFSTLKQQLTPRDSVLAIIKYQQYHSGDNFQYYDPTAVRADLQAFGITNAPVVRTNFNFDETQTPIAVLGYHHEWGPGMHTLFLAGRLENDQRFSDTDVSELVLSRATNGSVIGVASVPFDVTHETEFEIYTAELNQILQFERQSLIFGARFQGGTFQTTEALNLIPAASFLSTFFPSPPARAEIEDTFEHFTGYGYYTIEPISHLHLTGGVAYDWEKVPDNMRSPPVAEGTRTLDKVSPKAALVWSPLPEATFRGAYTKSLGGVSFDESFRLEPSQLAGFNQAFRTIIPESVVGSVTAPSFETADAALDLKFKSRTYVGFQVEALRSEVGQRVGVFDYNGSVPPPPPTNPGSTRENLDYKEYSALAGINQLVGDWFSLGLSYRFTRSKLSDQFPEIPAALSADAHRHLQADLHQTTFFALLNHPSGFFARWETQWYHQDNEGYTPALPGDDFFMHNIFVGYRLRRQYVEISFGVLNLTGSDYRLNPLSVYSELPRDRVFVGSLKFNF
jgi:tetratricopeptide (TPR) repeat protein